MSLGLFLLSFILLLEKCLWFFSETGDGFNSPNTHSMKEGNVTVSPGRAQRGAGGVVTSLVRKGMEA